MEFVALLRNLWRLRAVVAVVAIFAIFVGYSMAYRVPTLESKQYTVGVATATALVDTPSSQVVDLGVEQGVDVGGLSSRATLLASVMTSSPVKDKIAARAGIDPEKLIAVGPSQESPGGASPAATSDPKANVLKASVPTLEAGTIPIIVVETQSPDAKSAARLADGAITELKEHVQSLAVTDNVSDARRLVVRDLSPAHATTATQGPGKASAVIATIFVFLFGCGAVLGLVWLINAWRTFSGVDPDADADLAYFPPAPAAPYDEDELVAAFEDPADTAERRVS
jgi:hypothetical protein